MNIAPFGSTKWSLALQEAFRWHHGQVRKHSGLPYVIHCVEVSQVLERLGFDESVQITALLHDTLEDTAMPPERIESLFGSEVLAFVRLLSETKYDETGRKRPWISRKRDHLEVLKQCPMPVRAVALADQWHNLKSILNDWRPGNHFFWEAFHAPAPDETEYHRRRRAVCDQGERTLKLLACEVLSLIETLTQRIDQEMPGVPQKFSSRDWAC